MALWSPSILLVGRFVRARVNPPSTENHEKQYWLKDRLWLSQIIDPSIHPQRGGEARGKEQTLRLITDTWTCLGTDWFPGPSKAICLLGSGCRPFALGYLLSPRSWDLL
ncbi:hypothetical protein L1987_89643 [Smallanthus sonchifolius]|nr:hypothetical protein L1987_89643 [Smallanthus sonchifolius]